MKDLLIPFVAATIICIAIFWGIDVRFEANETLQYGKSLPYAFNEHEGDKIQIAYREYNGEILDVSRSTIIVDGRMVMALFGLFWACVMCLLRSDDRGS